MRYINLLTYLPMCNAMQMAVMP